MTSNWWHAHLLQEQGPDAKAKRLGPKAKRLGQEPEGKDGKVGTPTQRLSLLQEIAVLNQRF